mgnify:CR=1 FL=1
MVTTYENVGNTWTSDLTDGWSSSYMYDQNSNLTRVKRSEALSATPGLYDDVTIAPKDLSGNNSNVIDVVTDAGTNAVAGFTDLRTQTTAQNEVDVTGRVVEESNSGLARTNTWTSTDALSTATAGTTEARYLYDAAGNVVRVIVDNAGTDSTIYRIPSGGIADVATYKRVGNSNVVPMEWTIIGNGVIGVSRDVEDPETGPTFHRRVGTKLYALADHLGSVRAVVGDVKIPASGGTFTADVMSVYDYEAYGVPRPGLSLDVRAYWRYGFQGMLKQSELLGSTTDVSDYLTPFRSYDARSGRWRSHDPIFQPWESTYLGMGGNPAMMVDPWGLDPTELANPLMPNKVKGSLPPLNMSYQKPQGFDANMLPHDAGKSQENGRLTIDVKSVQSTTQYTADDLSARFEYFTVTALENGQLGFVGKYGNEGDALALAVFDECDSRWTVLLPQYKTSKERDQANAIRRAEAVDDLKYVMLGIIAAPIIIVGAVEIAPLAVAAMPSLSLSLSNTATSLLSSGAAAKAFEYINSVGGQQIVSRVFWSGGQHPQTMQAAAQFAVRNGAVTLEMTRVGKTLELLGQYLPRSIMTPFWQGASSAFAQGAQGTAHVFHGSVVHLGRVWATTEYPILMQNQIPLMFHSVGF